MSVSCAARLFAFATLVTASLLRADCVVPPAPILWPAPQNAVVGRPYVIAWSEVGDVFYVVERSRSSTFDEEVEQQQSGNLAASFVATEEAIYYHRVRSVASCDSTKQSAYSSTQVVNVARGAPAVVFTMHPQAQLVGVGDSLEKARATMAVENIGRSPVTIALVAESIGTAPFFSIVDPAGGNVDALLLTPSVPRQLEIRFAGPSTSARGVYEGRVSIRGVGEALAVVPYAYVQLKIGNSPGSGALSFRVAGATTDSVSFPGYPSGMPDTSRPPVTVELVNDGDTEVDVGAEIAPEGWLHAKSGWNGAAIPPRSAVKIELSTDRTRALAGSAFPRFTYFTVRSREGKTARLLVQDNDAISTSTSTATAASGTNRVLLLPNVVATSSSTGKWSTRMRLTNLAAGPVAVELTFFPAMTVVPVGRAILTVAAHDVLFVPDVVRQLFTDASTLGHLAITIPEESADSMIVNAATYATSRTTGVEIISTTLPVIRKGEGARVGEPHVISGVVQNSLVRAHMIIMETSGTAAVVAHCDAFDVSGVGPFSFTVALRPGESAFVVLAPHLPSTFTNGHVRISVEGSGSVVGVVIIVDDVTGSTRATHVSEPLLSGASKQSTVGDIEVSIAATPSVTTTHLVLGASNGAVAGLPYQYTTSLGITALGSPATLNIGYLTQASLSSVMARVSIPAGATLDFPNVLQQLFAIPAEVPSRGTLVIQTATPIEIYGRVIDSTHLKLGSVVGALPVITTLSEAITSTVRGMERPVYFEGLEQSLDPTRGKRWTLSLTELANRPAVATVRLYEPGNRTWPIAEQDVTLGPRQHKDLETIFSCMGLDQENRRSERTNVQVVVSPKSGAGAVAAVAVGYDNATGATMRYLLTPTGGVLATGVTRVTTAQAIDPFAAQPRRRSVGR